MEVFVLGMRDYSPPNDGRPRFATIRRQLLWSYGVLVFLILGLTASFGWMFLDYYAQVDELLSLNASTATITIKLEDTHQLLENTINYEDESYIRPYRNRRDDLEDYIREYDSLALRTAELLNDFDAYYQFLEIQELILIYAAESDILLSLFGRGAQRIELYDKLYSLRDLNYRIYELQSALLVRQNNYLRNFYNDYAPLVRRRLIGLSGIALVFVLFAVVWTLRQAAAISRPLHRLATMNMELAAGRFDAVEPLEARNREIQALADSMVYMAARLSDSIELEKRNFIMENSLKQARLEALQAQVNPHFLFNALNTVKSLSQIEDATRTESILEALAAFLRYTLENPDSQVTVSQEFAMAEHYLRIQKMRFGNRLSYEVDLDEAVADVLVPSLIVQPLVENAVIHGIEPRKDGGTVHLSAAPEDVDRTCIEVFDDGAGMSEDDLARIETLLFREPTIEGTHVGLRNTWRRLKLVDPDAHMEFRKSNAGGVVVRLSLSTGFRS